MKPTRLDPRSVPSMVVTVDDYPLPTIENTATVEEAELMGMKVRCPIDSPENNRQRAIRQLRANLNDVEVVEDSWSASWLDYITKEEPYDETVATDVRGILFPTVYKYERRTGTQTKIIGEWWAASVYVWPSSL